MSREWKKVPKCCNLTLDTGSCSKHIYLFKTEAAEFLVLIIREKEMGNMTLMLLLLLFVVKWMDNSLYLK